MLEPYSETMSRWRAFQVRISSSTGSSPSSPRSSPFHARHCPSRNRSTVSGNLSASTSSLRRWFSTISLLPAPAAAATSTHARRKSPPTRAAAALTACDSIATPVSPSQARHILRSTTLSCRELANRRASTSTLRAGESNSLFFRGTYASYPPCERVSAALRISRLVRPRTTQSPGRRPRASMSSATNSASRSGVGSTSQRTTAEYAEYVTRKSRQGIV